MKRYVIPRKGGHSLVHTPSHRRNSHDTHFNSNAETPSPSPNSYARLQDFDSLAVDRDVSLVETRSSQQIVQAKFDDAARLGQVISVDSDDDDYSTVPNGGELKLLGDVTNHQAQKKRPRRLSLSKKKTIEGKSTKNQISKPKTLKSADLFKTSVTKSQKSKPKTRKPIGKTETEWKGDYNAGLRAIEDERNANLQELEEEMARLELDQMLLNDEKMALAREKKELRKKESRLELKQARHSKKHALNQRMHRDLSEKYDIELERFTSTYKSKMADTILEGGDSSYSHDFGSSCKSHQKQCFSFAYKNHRLGSRNKSYVGSSSESEYSF